MHDGPQRRRVALVGSPNSGKTSVYNALTGLRQKVANYAGVTVEYVEAVAHTPAGDVAVIDLPGVYSLEPLSPDERVTVDVVTGRSGAQPPDAIVVVADATTLDRGLATAAEVLGLGRPTLLVLTMIDELKARGGSLDLGKLQRRLGIPVVGVVGNRGLGIDDLRAMLGDPTAWSRASEAIPPGQSAEDVTRRFEWASHIAGDCVKAPTAQAGRTDRIDRVLLHPVWGVATFTLAMVLFFQVVFVVAAPLQDLFEQAVMALGSLVADVMPDGLVESLLVDGLIAGVGSVVVFVPQVALLLLMIALLEGTGYLARAAFLIDRVMGWVGLEGRSFVALLSSYACAIPGVMAARTVPDPKARLATILVAPLMTCSARLPVYGLLIGAFVPRRTVLGVFNLQGLTLFGLYLLGAVTAMVAAALIRRGLRRGETWPFYMQLPPYRVPTPKVVFEQVWRGVRGFLRRAGTVILAGSIVLWALMAFPRTELPPDQLAAIELAGGEPAVAAAAWQLEHSYAASLGRAIEPVFAPLGFDWKINVGIIASTAAREVIVATLAQIYAFGGGEDDTVGLGDRLRAEQRDGQPAYTIATALPLLVFYVFALQCISTIAVIRRETGSWRWPAFAWTYMFALAWSLAWITRVVCLRVM